MSEVLELRMRLSLAESAQSQLRAKYQAVRIETGAWKNRIGQVFKGGLPEHGGVAMTEQEVLNSEVVTMNTHISLAQDHLEYAKGILSELKEAESK